MDPRLDGERMAAWRAFLAAHRQLLEQLTEELAEARDLPLTWYDVLVSLEESPADRLRMTELAERIMLSQSGLTRLVDRMATNGLVRREQCPTDRRGTFVALTAAGRAALHDAAPVHLAGVAEHFAAQLDDTEARTLRVALERVADSLRPPA